MMHFVTGGKAEKAVNLDFTNIPLSGGDEGKDNADNVCHHQVDSRVSEAGEPRGRDPDEDHSETEDHERAAHLLSPVCAPHPHLLFHHLLQTLLL